MFFNWHYDQAKVDKFYRKPVSSKIENNAQAKNH